MTFWDHLVEFRTRVFRALSATVIGMIVAFIWIEPAAFQLLLEPLGDRNLMYLGLGEAFMTHLLLSLCLGVVVAIPYIAYQIWAFVSPGLFRNERLMVMKFASLSTVLFAIGALFGYYLLVPVMVEFFLSFEQERLTYGGALGPYLKMVLGVIIGAGLAFQLPMVLIGLVKAGIFSAADLSNQRPYWVLAIAIASALLTPADLLSQILLLFPMWMLFELTVLFARLSAAKR